MATDAAALGCLRFVPNEPPERARLGPLRLLLPPIGGVCRAVARTSGLSLIERFPRDGRHALLATRYRQRQSVGSCLARGLPSASRRFVGTPQGPQHHFFS